MELTTGTVLERYTVERTLGAGGMAVVYLARHNQIGSLHAVKVLTVHGRVIRERLLQEGRVQAGLRHPNVVTVTDLVEVDGAPALVLEYVRGPSLAALLARTRPTLAQVDALARGILKGVAAAHKHGLVHRDLKPANVLVAVSDDGLVPKIADFGLGKLVRSATAQTVTRTGATMGTPAYMAPEQIRDSAAVDERADVFALGAILYELLTGEMAFRGEDTLETFERIARGQYASLDEVAPALPERMRQAVRAALEVDRELRPADAGALLEAWTGQAEGLAAEPLSDTDLWSAEILEAADELAPSAAESLESSGASGSGPESPNTFAMSLGDLSTGAGGEPSLAPASLDPISWGDAAKWSLLGGVISGPFALGGLVAVLGSIGAIGMTGLWGGALFGAGIAGGAMLAALAVLWRTGRASRHMWWLVVPAVLAILGNIGTGLGTTQAMVALGQASVNESAGIAGHGSAVALTTELVAMTLAAMLLMATADLSAGLVLVRRGGPGKLTSTRRVVAMVLSVALGTALWLATTLWLTEGAVPFAVFLILVGVSMGMALVSFEDPDPDERTAEMRMLTGVAGALGVLAAAKVVWLQQVVGILSGVESGGGLAAAEQFGLAMRGSGASLVVAWGAAAALVAVVSLTGPGRPRVCLRTTVQDVLPLLLLLLPLLGSKVWADKKVAELTGEVVPSFLNAEVDRTLGMALTDRELMAHRARVPGAFDPALELMRQWSDPERDAPEGAIVVDAGSGTVLQADDVILGVDGRRVAGVAALLEEVLACDCEQVILTVDRAGALHELHAEVRGVRGRGTEVRAP